MSLNKLPEKVTDKEVIIRKVWIVLAQIRIMRHINDARYLPKCTNLNIETVKKSLEKNVQSL